jgi:hypothetical protein
MKIPKITTKIFSFAFLFITLLIVGFLINNYNVKNQSQSCPKLPPNVAVDGYAISKVHTFIDINEDGKADPNEPPLPKVKITYPYLMEKSPYTDNIGNITTFVFKAGCNCKCWEGEFVQVAIPVGYQATTPIRKYLTDNDLLFEFGFVNRNP